MSNLNDVFNNCGLPQFTNKKINEFSKNDIKYIIKTIKEFDSYYVSGWINSKDRETLINFINNVCVVYRWYSLITK